MILHNEFGLIWTIPGPDEKDLFLKFLFREIQKVPYEIPKFFLGKLYQKLSLFYNLITLVVLHAESGLIWTTSWTDEKEVFLKFAKIRIFFLNKLLQKFFLLHTLITNVILHTELGLIWTAPWPDEKDIL